MKNNTNLRISIPKPCHEDWNKFTPDEKGAFCKVCSKSVHDFTKKTADEISMILIDEMSAGKKVCGRFNEDQLTPVPEIIPSLSLYSLNFVRLKKFALALFLVFGGYLFSNYKAQAQKMGKVAYIPKPEPVKGEVSPRYVEPKDTVTSPRPSPLRWKTESVRFGGQGEGATLIRKCDKTKMLKGDVAIEPIEKLIIMGGAVAGPIGEPIITEIINTTPTVLGQAIISEPVIGDTIVVGDVVGMEESMIMGVVAMPDPTPALPQGESEGDSLLINQLSVPESTFVEITNPEENKVFSEGEAPIATGIGETIVCYPNPSSNGDITLRYNLKKDGMTSISLFDLNGNLVKTLLPMQSIDASSCETKYDVSDLKDGIYFCELVSGNNKTTTRIVISK